MAKLPRTRPIPKYERWLILFIDVLGFKEVVASTERDPDGLGRLLAAMDDIGTLGEASIFKSQRVTQFSDSVVMSYRVTGALGRLLDDQFHRPHRYLAGGARLPAARRGYLRRIESGLRAQPEATRRRLAAALTDFQSHGS